jgi:putative ABC transport system permease protein
MSKPDLRLSTLPAMRQLRAFLVRLSSLFGKDSRDCELDRELDSHLHMEIDANLRAGMTPEEARREALVRFGGIESVKEAYRDRRGIPFIETTLRDARYALRTLRRNRSATAIGILVMALGIGANTAVFSVVHAVLLNPLPYTTPDRIVTLTYLASGGNAAGDRSMQVSIPDFLDWQRDSKSFDSMAYYSARRASVMTGSAAEYALVTSVSPEFFRVFGVQPSAGRLFNTEEAREGGTGAAVLSERYARQQFGDPRLAVGRTVRLFSRSVSVIGVVPARLEFPADTDIWFPIEILLKRAELHRRGNNFRAAARLNAGQSVEQAQTEMTALSARLEAQYPETNRNMRVLVTPLQSEMVGNVESMLYLLLGAVAFVLLIACATMATLLLARATARAPEIAVRVALGASRSRIVKQLLVEASVQAFAAGSLGVLIAIWGTRTLVALSPPEVPRLDEVAVNGSVLLFTLALCVLVSILFGLPPALQAARVDVAGPLGHGAGRVAGGRGSRTREGLVVAEIALAVVLVITGGLLVRSLVALQQAPLGFDPHHVFVMQASALPLNQDWSDSRAYFQGLLADVAQMPGVIAAGAMMGPPGRVQSDSGYWIDRMPKESALSLARPAAMNVIAPGTFAALGVPVRQGRDFQDGDRAGAPRVVIINEALARAAFRDRDPIGRAIVAAFDSMEPMTIVGVVGDVRQYEPAREPQPEIYMPYQQHFYNGATLYIVARTATDPAAIGPAIQRKARERSPAASVRLSTMDAILAEHFATPKFRAWLLGLFGAVALCLAMAGVYGVMAYVVGQRSKEIGLRMALGASARSVLWLMLGRGLTLTAVGLAVGVLGAIGAARLVSGMLFQVTPGDVATYAGAVAGLGLLSLLATYMPARRATRIDPLVVLRQE